MTPRHIYRKRKVELVFDCHNYSKNKKLKVAIIEFLNYAIVWWDQLVLNEIRNRELAVETWEEMAIDDTNHTNL